MLSVQANRFTKRSLLGSGDSLSQRVKAELHKTFFFSQTFSLFGTRKWKWAHSRCRQPSIRCPPLSCPHRCASFGLKTYWFPPSDCHTNYTLHQLGVFNELHPVKRRAALSHCTECQRRLWQRGREVAKKKNKRRSQKRAYKTAERGWRAAEWGKSIQRRPVDCDGGSQKKGRPETKGAKHCLGPVCLRPSVLL